jgi:hypothetical protein
MARQAAPRTAQVRQSELFNALNSSGFQPDALECTRA